MPTDISPIEIEEFISRLSEGGVKFEETLRLIGRHYDYRPTGFRNGLGEAVLDNPAGTNEGSCKVFAFGMINNLVDEAVLEAFGEHYREVLADREGAGHQNIRNFMAFGYGGVEFDDMPLRPKSH